MFRRSLTTFSILFAAFAFTSKIIAAPIDVFDPNTTSSAYGLSFPVPQKLFPFTAAVGAVILDQPPYRATLSYLGHFQGEELFLTSKHLVFPQTALAAELFEPGGQKLRIALDPIPLFSTTAGDAAILRAATNIDPDLKKRLRAIKPIRLTSLTPEAVLSKWPNAKYFATGRGSVVRLKQFLARPELANPSVRELWAKADIDSEARKNLDERPIGERIGDVAFVASVRMVGGGFTKFIYDPDGLVPGKAPAPYLQVQPDWLVDSLAIQSIMIGRSSGSPIVVLTPDHGMLAFAIHWTSGIAMDVISKDNQGSSFLQKCALDGSLAFGDVFQTINEKGEVTLGNRQPAPFTYSSPFSRLFTEISQDPVSQLPSIRQWIDSSLK